MDFLFFLLDPAIDVDFHPIGAAIGTGNSGGSVKIYDLRTGLMNQHYHAHTGSVNKAKFHPNGNFMLTASEDGTMKVENKQKKKKIKTE